MGFEKRRLYSENASNVFRSHLHCRNLKTQQSTAILDLCAWKVRMEFAFETFPIPKCFPSTWKRKASVFQCLLFEDRSRKASRFPWRKLPKLSACTTKCMTTINKIFIFTLYLQCSVYFSPAVHVILQTNISLGTSASVPVLRPTM